MRVRLAVVVGWLALCWIASAEAQEKKTEKAKPKPKAPTAVIRWVEPTGSATLSGPVKVRIRIEAPQGAALPTIVYAGLGGPPWIKLSPIEKTSEWTGTLDSSMVPNGPERLMVLTNAKARAEMSTTVQNPLKIFFGDLHSHTSYSDGQLVPKAAFEYARDVAKLDVFALTDHLEAVDDTEWRDMRDEAGRANEDGRFVAMAALEWTKKDGHALIFDPKTRIWPTDVAGFYEAIAKCDVVVKFNHPARGDTVFNGLAFDQAASKVISMMEVRTPDEELAYIRALSLGWKIAPDGSDDTHTANWGSARAWTGILAPGLTHRCIWDALKNRRMYSTLDRNCRLSFEVNGYPMGEIVEKPAETVAVAVALEDPDPNDVIDKVELFEDGKVVATEEPKKTQCTWTPKVAPSAGPHYYFVKATQADGNLLRSAPVWITVAEKSAAK